MDEQTPRICPGCERETLQLIEHHWFDDAGDVYTKDICPSCNGILSTGRGDSNHVLPPWPEQRRVCRIHLLHKYCRWLSFPLASLAVCYTIAAHLRTDDELAKWERCHTKTKLAYFKPRGAWLGAYERELEALLNTYPKFRVLLKVVREVETEYSLSSQHLVDSFSLPWGGYDSNMHCIPLNSETLSRTIENSLKWVEDHHSRIRTLVEHQMDPKKPKERSNWEKRCHRVKDYMRTHPEQVTQVVAKHELEALSND